MKTSLTLSVLLFTIVSYSQPNVGIGTTTPLARLHVADSSVLFSGPAGSLNLLSYGNVPISGAGKRMMWYANKAAFRAGVVDGAQWDKDNIGVISLATGYNTKASGKYSTAMGYETVASAENSTAIGARSVASALYSNAIGYYATARGIYSTAIGMSTEANGYSAIAMGEGTIAPSDAELAVGTYNTSYTPFSVSDWWGADRLFVIGNGTSPAARRDAFTVLKNGYIGIGTSTPPTKLAINGGNGDVLTILNGGDTRIYNDDGTGSLLFYASGGTGVNKSVFTVVSDGKTFSFNGTGGSVSSDKRLKQDIEPLTGSLKKVMRLNGYSYRFKTKATDRHKEIGVLAQEVKKVLPDAVYTDDKGMYSVSYNSLVPLLINAIKEQQLQVEALKANDKLQKKKLDEAITLKAENETLKQRQQELAKRMEALEAYVMNLQHSNETISKK